MKIICFSSLIILMALSACKNDSGAAGSDGSQASGQNSFNWDDSEYYLKHPFSETFVTGVGKLGKPVSFAPNQIIVDGAEPVEFPSNPAINRVYHLKGTKNDITYKLDAVRINYSTVRFRLEIEKEGKVAESYEGDADINPEFYLGAETDTDELNAITYPVYEFSYLKNACTTILRIGSNEEGAVMARISRNCYDSTRNIALESSPTLR